MLIGSECLEDNFKMLVEKNHKTEYFYLKFPIYQVQIRTTPQEHSDMSALAKHYSE